MEAQPTYADLFIGKPWPETFARTTAVGKLAA